MPALTFHLIIYRRLLADLADKEVYVDVIAKNFTTLEPGIG